MWEKHARLHFQQLCEGTVWNVIAGFVVLESEVSFLKGKLHKTYLAELEYKLTVCFDVSSSMDL